MSGKRVNFDDKEIKRSNSYRNKKVTKIGVSDVN